MTLTIVPFEFSDHFEGAVDILVRMRQLDDTYPPMRDAGGDRASLGNWLFDEVPVQRWVGMDGGKVVGHITVGDPHSYLTEFLTNGSFTAAEISGLSEVGKFFVDPDQQGTGVGYKVFKFVVSNLLESEKRPVLAVLSGSTAAIRFYERFGMNRAGSFVGVHGENHVYVGVSTSNGNETHVD